MKDEPVQGAGSRDEHARMAARERVRGRKAQDASAAAAPIAGTAFTHTKVWPAALAAGHIRGQSALKPTPRPIRPAL